MLQRSTKLDFDHQEASQRRVVVLLRIITVLALLMHSGLWLRSSVEVNEEMAGPKVLAYAEMTYSPSCKVNDFVIRRFVGEIASFSDGAFDLVETFAPRHFAAWNYCKSAPSLCCRLCYLAQHALAGGQLS